MEYVLWDRHFQVSHFLTIENVIQSCNVQKVFNVGFGFNIKDRIEYKRVVASLKNWTVTH